MTTHERRNPRFVTARAAVGGAKLEPFRDWPGGDCPELTGYGFDSAIVVCTYADLDEEHFRTWLKVVLATRIDPDARRDASRQQVITLEVL